MSDKLHSMITLGRAREIASDVAAYNLAGFLADKTISLLQEEYLEAENCWMFFRNKAIVLPPEGALSDFAYCVSKKGAARSVLDFSENSVRLHEYLESMSNHFKERGL